MDEASTVTPARQIKKEPTAQADGGTPSGARGKKKTEQSPALPDAPDSSSQVLVIYAGGTIGMTAGSDGSGYKPVQDHLYELLSKNPNTNVKQAGSGRAKSLSVLVPQVDPAMTKRKADKLTALNLKPTREGYKIVYCILEYNPLCDSSNMDMDDWKKIAETISDNYNATQHNEISNFSGFVILHGTDTMAYTASALSYMLKNLGKPVILTGSQLPMEQLQSDAIDNFIGALVLAGQYSHMLPEVGLYFNNELLRGNRTTKQNASEFNAFSSPNFPPLAKVGVSITISDKVRPHARDRFFLPCSKMNSEVGAFFLFPGITATTMRSCLQNVKGAVILTYGAGNGPDEYQELLDVFRAAADTGVLLLNITQCLKGEVEAVYATGKRLKDAGLIPGGDMTVEAALTKLSFVIALDDNMSYGDKKRKLEKDLRGELTVKPES